MNLPFSSMQLGSSLCNSLQQLHVHPSTVYTLGSVLLVMCSPHRGHVQNAQHLAHLACWNLPSPLHPPLLTTSRVPRSLLAPCSCTACVTWQPTPFRPWQAPCSCSCQAWSSMQGASSCPRASTGHWTRLNGVRERCCFLRPCCAILTS